MEKVNIVQCGEEMFFLHYQICSMDTVGIPTNRKDNINVNE